MKKTTLIILLLAALIPAAVHGGEKPKTNVLFISVDDLRPELGCYGSKIVKTPQIDRLAEMGTLFERAYCQQAVCSPSRVSLLCGQRPDTTKIWDLKTKFRKIQPNIVTLPQYFKNNGYHSYRLGKIFHLSHGQKEDRVSWSTISNARGRRYIRARKNTKPAVEAADVPDNKYNEGAYTDDAIKAMKRFKKGGEPFFLAVVILWGDHGWKLNDYANWCKHSNMEIDTWVPLIISAPGRKAGQRTRALVEYVDIYPTLAEICGLKVPEQCEGSSMVPLLEKPGRSWKTAAFSQFPRRGLMGYSIRSGRWRYTEWIDRKTGDIKDRELYDHKNGPLATQNQAADPKLAVTVRSLSKVLAKGQGWKIIKREVESR